MTKTVKQLEGEVTVTSSLSRMREIIKQDARTEKFTVRPFASEVAHVSVRKGLTRNLGDFESARVDVTLTMPCYPEEALTVFEAVNEAVEDMVSDEMKKFEEGQ